MNVWTAGGAARGGGVHVDPPGTVQGGLLDTLPSFLDTLPCFLDTDQGFQDKFPSFLNTLPSFLDTYPCFLDTLPYFQAGQHEAAVFTSTRQALSKEGHGLKS